MIDITPQYLAEQGLSPTFPQRFWKKVQKTDSCWLWIGQTRGGYGRISKAFQHGVGTGMIGAHVASWMLHKGAIPNSLCVLHNCPDGDNGLCVNPDHLWLGTRTDNNVDKAVKGRTTSHLSESDVATIRSLSHEGTKQLELAKRFALSQSAISMIVSGKRHKLFRRPSYA